VPVRVVCCSAGLAAGKDADSSLLICLAAVRDGLGMKACDLRTVRLFCAIKSESHIFLSFVWFVSLVVNIRIPFINSRISFDSFAVAGLCFAPVRVVCCSGRRPALSRHPAACRFGRCERKPVAE
jgi:hypothetical protein